MSSQVIFETLSRNVGMMFCIIIFFVLFLKQPVEKQFLLVGERTIRGFGSMPVVHVRRCSEAAALTAADLVDEMEHSLAEVEDERALGGRSRAEVARRREGRHGVPDVLLEVVDDGVITTREILAIGMVGVGGLELMPRTLMIRIGLLKTLQ